jgi:4'-phosphopantetheinyl transferase
MLQTPATSRRIAVSDTSCPIHIVYAKPVPTRQVSRVSGLLTDRELQRAAFFRTEDDRRLFVTCRALLRTRLSEVVDVAPADWRFTTNCYGRPEIAEPVRFRHLRFNVSHCQGLVVCALSHGPDVGVDAEMIQEPDLDVIDLFFSPSEAAAIKRSDSAHLPYAFFRQWTLKESYIKARGIGLSLALNSFAIDIGTDGSIELRIEDRADAESKRWEFRSMQPLPTHVASICVGARNGMNVSILESWADMSLLA